MLSGKHITVIIPALNEAGSIAKVISEIPACVDNIIVVDNGSTDRTDIIAKSAGASVIYQHVRGYGAACLAGIRSIRHTDIVGFVDGDYSDFPEDLKSLLEPIAEEKYDLVLGKRHCIDEDDRALLFHQRLGNWVACCLIYILHGTAFGDLGPMRCITWNSLNNLRMEDENFGWTAEMQIKASRLNLRIWECPVRYRSRIGQSKISGTFKGSIYAGYKILYWTLRLSIFNKSIINN